MSDTTLPPKNAAEAFQKLVGVVDQLVGLPRKIREAYREFHLDGVIRKINERLYGRYKLIYVLRNFDRMTDSKECFDWVIMAAKERTEYLREFNKRVEPKINKKSPKLAANLIFLTNESIGLYEQLAAMEDVDQMAQMAPKLADELKNVADYLERVNDKLKALTSGS